MTKKNKENMMMMKRKELVGLVSEKTGLEEKKVNEVMMFMCCYIEQALIQGKVVDLDKNGRFMATEDGIVVYSHSKLNMKK